MHKPKMVLPVKNYKAIHYCLRNISKFVYIVVKLLLYIFLASDIGVRKYRQNRPK